MKTVRKKGEVVEPAGGETGVPRCLAEVRKLLRAALFQCFKLQFSPAGEACQTKNKNFWSLASQHSQPNTLLLYKPG